MTTTLPTSLTLPPADANLPAALDHLVSNSGLAYMVLFGFDAGSRVAKLTVPPNLLSDGQKALWRWCGEMAGRRTDYTIFDVLGDPHVDAASQDAVIDALAVAFGREPGRVAA